MRTVSTGTLSVINALELRQTAVITGAHPAPVETMPPPVYRDASACDSNRSSTFVKDGSDNTSFLFRPDTRTGLTPAMRVPTP